MSISSTLENIKNGVTGYFGGKTNDPTYGWAPHLEAFLTEQRRVLENQHKWCLNPGYSFSVSGAGPKSGAWGPSVAIPGIPQEEDSQGNVINTSGNFSEFKFNVNPSEITFREPFAIDIIPTQTGYAVQHSGCVMRDIIIAGTTGVHPGRGSGGITRNSIGGLLASDNTDGSKDFEGIPLMLQGGTGIFTGERPGYVHFHLLRNYIKAYVQLKANPENKNMKLVFNNLKDGESWVVEPAEFTMVRSSRMPISYNYQIVLRALQRTPYIPESAKNNFGIWGTFLSGVQYIDQVVAAASDFINIGAGIINQSVEYIRQIYQGVEALVLTPIREVTNVLAAVSNGVNTISALPRQFYTNLEIELCNMEDVIADIANMGDDDYNVTFGRVKTPPQKATAGFNTTEYDILKGVNSIIRGLNLITANDLFFSNPITEPVVTTIDTFNTGNSVNLSNDQRAALRHTTNNGIIRMFGGRMSIANPSSVKEVFIRTNETLEMIASRTLGDAGRWTDIAILNGLKFPYIEISGSMARGTKSYGDKIYIPSTNLPKVNLAIPARRSYITRDMSENEKNLGVDLELSKDYDLRVSNTGDLDLVAGAGNAVQCINLMLLTEKGDLKYHPYRGVSLFPGVTKWQQVQDMLNDIRVSIISDGRFESVTDLSLRREGTAVYINMNVVVTDFDEAVPLQLML